MPRLYHKYIRYVAALACAAVMFAPSDGIYRDTRFYSPTYSTDDHRLGKLPTILYPSSHSHAGLKAEPFRQLWSCPLLRIPPRPVCRFPPAPLGELMIARRAPAPILEAGRHGANQPPARAGRLDSPSVTDEKGLVKPPHPVCNPDWVKELYPAPTSEPGWPPK